MYQCNGKLGGSTITHTHEFSFQGKVCYGLTGYKPTPAPVVRVPPPFGSRRNPSGPLSEPQYKYIVDLGGEADKARWMTYEAASRYITDLKGGTIMSSPLPTPQRDPRFDMIETLLTMVPDGYYAIGDDAERIESLTFIRLSKPTKGRHQGEWKFQEVIGSGLGYRLADFAWRSREGRWVFSGGIYKTEAVLETVMQICADHVSAAILYARHIGRCARCNATLTDERSRWYGIGPECEKHWPHHMDQIEATKGVFV